MPVRMTAYKCEYCGRMYESYSGAWKHEGRCFANPESRACRTCKHCEFVCEYDSFDDELGAHTRYFEYFVCMKTGKALNHPDRARKWKRDCCLYGLGEDVFGRDAKPKHLEEVAGCQEK